MAGVEVDEDRLENDFDRLTAKLVMAGTDGFMFRDFQSRNIMVLDDEVYFIDYQGGRQGALHYDVASLLYDAIVKIPESQKEELLDFYIRELTESEPGFAEKFREIYYHFVLVRLLQAMGAFGFAVCTRENLILLTRLFPVCRVLARCSNPANWKENIPRFSMLSEWLLKNTLYLCTLKVKNNH